MRRVFTFLVSVLTFRTLTGCSGAPSPADGSEAGAESDASAADAGGDAPDASPDAVGSQDAQGDTGGPADGGMGLKCTGAAPSFARDVHPLLNACGGEMCHGGLANGTWPYTSLVDVKATRDHCSIAGLIVLPSNLEGSYLLHKLTGVGICSGTARMPSGGVPLPKADIQIIADWICQGAKNN